MKTVVKTAVENSLIALLVAAVCLWMLVTAANLEDPPAARIVLLSLGLACALVVHLVFMVLAGRRSGRPMGAWIAALILLPPLSSVALIALLYLEDKPGQVT